MIMEAVALLRRNPRPSELEIREAMSGHLCRCGTYSRVIKAIHLAADTMRR
jgi:aerobic-type carbon monoxide dehydrogenase small subunit (CoxS/CutS family)